MAERQQADEARREIMATIRQHLAASAPFDAVHAEHHGHHVRATHAAGAALLSQEQLGGSAVEQFKQALEAVAGRCAVVPDEGEAAAALRMIIEEKRARRIAVSDSVLVRRIVAPMNVDVELLEDAAPLDLFDCDMGVTTVQWAVAETGTLVLESERERHRLSSLVPPVHVAIIQAGQIKQTLSEVLQTLSEKGSDQLSRTITLITGPSRTSDIELTLAIGVHGPGELFVIIIEGEGHD